MNAGKPDPQERRQSPGVAARQALRREERIDAAMAIVAQRGLAALSAASLAEATGTVPAALYRTFPSMDALKGELVARALDRLAAAMSRSLLQPHPGDAHAVALARVHTVARAIPLLREESPADHELIDAALSSLTPVFTDDVALRVETHLQHVLGIAAGVLADAARVGALAEGDAMQRTLILLALVHGTDHLTKRDRLEPRARHAAVVRDAAVRALLVGWATAQ